MSWDNSKVDSLVVGCWLLEDAVRAVRRSVEKASPHFPFRLIRCTVNLWSRRTLVHIPKDGCIEQDR